MLCGWFPRGVLRGRGILGRGRGEFFEHLNGAFDAEHGVDELRSFFVEFGQHLLAGGMFGAEVFKAFDDGILGHGDSVGVNVYEMAGGGSRSNIAAIGCLPNVAF